MASSRLLDALCDLPALRDCWACEGERTTSTGLALCYLCGGEGALPGNPLERRRGDSLAVYAGPERRNLAPAVRAASRHAHSASHPRSEPTLTAAVWNALGLLTLRPAL